MAIWYRRICLFATALALVVVVMGAWVRLSDAGLGCPDWPGCYGSLIVPSEAEHVSAAEEAFPERPLEASKAWKEMIHRYAASTLGFSIMLIALLAWLNRKDPAQAVKVPIALFFLVCFQGLLGMWTVTLLLKPLIVMGHLLGGLSTLGLLFWLVLENRYPKQAGKTYTVPKAAVAALAVLICQLALGGWTSSNYAALACPDLPTCVGQWWPEEADFAEGFVMWRGLGVDYEFGILDTPARVAIHFTHRLGAILAFLFIVFAAHKYMRGGTPRMKTAAALALVALTAQISLGLATVWFGLPLLVATSHNMVAALLLLSVINLNHAALREAQA